MSPPGRPKRKSRGVQHKGTPVSPSGRRKAPAHGTARSEEPG